jgi:hypothetical protein
MTTTAALALTGLGLIATGFCLSIGFSLGKVVTGKVHELLLVHDKDFMNKFVDELKQMELNNA